MFHYETKKCVNTLDFLYMYLSGCVPQAMHRAHPSRKCSQHESIKAMVDQKPPPLYATPDITGNNISLKYSTCKDDVNIM